MALEVGTLVARLKLEDELTSGLSKAQAGLEKTATDARKVDTELARITKTGKNVAVDSKARTELGRTSTAARDTATALSATSTAGRSLTVSGEARRTLSVTTGAAYSTTGAIQRVSAAGRGVTVSDQAAKGLGAARSAADQLGGSIDRVNVGLKQIGALAGIVSAGAAIAYVNTVGADFTDNLNVMGAVSGATAAEMGKISDTAKALGSDASLVGVSAGDAAGAMTTLAKAGFSVSDSMSAAKGSLALAGAAQVSATEAAEIQGRVLSTFNLNAGEAGRVADVLANATNASAMSMNDLALGMQAGGSVAAQFGMSVEDTAAALGFFSNNGIKGSDAGTLLKTAFLSLTDTGKPAQQAIETLGLTVYDAQGKFVGFDSILSQLRDNTKDLTEQEYQQATAVLFGTDAFRMSALARRAGADDYNVLREAMDKQGSAAELAAAKTKGLPGALNNLSNQAETAALEIYNLVDGPLAGLANYAADGIEKLPGAISAVGDAAAPVGAVVGEVVDVVAGLPGPVQAALAAMVALRVTGMGPTLTAAGTSATTTIRNLGGSIRDQIEYTRQAAVEHGRLGATIRTLEANSKTVAKMGDAYRGAAAPIQTFAARQQAAAGAARATAMSSRDAFTSIDALGRQMGHTAVGQVSKFGAALTGSAAAGLSAVRSGVGGVVGALGGPFAVGLAAATVVVGEMVASARRASEANNALRDAATNGAAAQRDLALALAESSGAMDANAAAAAEKVIGTVVEANNKLAESATGAFNVVDGPLHRLRNNYDGLADAAKNYGDSNNGARAQAGMARLEMQALGDATAEAGITMDEVNGVVAKGGPQYESLRVALANTGSAGQAVAEKLAEARASIDAAREATLRAEPGSYQLAEAFRVMSDEAATADDKAKALDAALDALAGGTKSADDAMQSHHDTVRKIAEATSQATDQSKGWGQALLDNNGKLSTVTENGSALRDQLLDLRRTTSDAAASGADMSAVWAQTDQTFAQLGESTGLGAEKIRELAADLGLLPETIGLAVAVNGSDESIAAIATVADQLRGLPQGKTIEIPVEDENAIETLRRLGWQVETIPGSKNVKVTASTKEAQAGLEQTAIEAGKLGGLDVWLDVMTNAEDVTGKLNAAGFTAQTLPSGHIEISDTTPENMKRLADLGIKTSEPKNGKVTITDNTADVHGKIDGLNGRSTEGSHNVFVNVFQGIKSALGFADGGIIPAVAAFADGGVEPPLPKRARNVGVEDRTAQIAPAGAWRVWAEDETGGEAYIPLAPSKRARSLSIWEQTGRLLGALGPSVEMFADGGFSASKALTGTDYIWGGFSPAGVDCSGLVSAAANEATGRPAFSERATTHTMGPFLAARGFLPGPGGPGDLRIGWNGTHTSGTAPDGTPFESQTYGRGAVWGGDSRGHDNPEYTQHMHLPMGEPEGGGRGGVADTRTQREKNIDAIVEEGMRRGLSDRDIQVALMTAEQESGIRVLANPNDPASMGMANEGVGTDHDSTGIFQQRNNGAWGTLADRMDPTKSAGMFYDQLEKIEGREAMRLTEVAQKVQRSAYPEAYAKHEGKAAELLSASKGRISKLGSGSNGSADGQRVFVTNWPGGSFSGGSSGVSGGSRGGDVGSSPGGSGDPAIREGSLAAMLLAQTGLTEEQLLGSDPSTPGGKEKRFDDTKILEKQGDIEAAREQARIAQIKLDELQNKTDSKGRSVTPSESALASAKLRVEEANRKIAKLEHDLRELERTSAEVRAHNESIGIDVTNYADGGFHGVRGGFGGLENHTAHIAPAGSYRVFGESETGGEAYIPLASSKRARSVDIWMETGKRLGMFGMGLGHLALSALPILSGDTRGLSTDFDPSLEDFGVDGSKVVEALQPGVNAQAAEFGQQVATAAAEFLTRVHADVGAAVDGVSAATRQQGALAREQIVTALI